MLDFESPTVKRVLSTTGVSADVIAIATVVFQVTKQQAPPWWAVLLFLFGVVLVFASKSPPGDFLIKRREIIVDIKHWNSPALPNCNRATTYRVDEVRCRRWRSRFLIYEEYASTGARTSTYVLNFPFTEEPMRLNPGAADLKIDLGTNCTYGKEYSVVSRCEYADSFSDAMSEYYEIKISYPTDFLKITILLPANKPCKNAGVKKRVGATTESEPLPSISENCRVIVWERKKPDFNTKFKVFWEW